VPCTFGVSRSVVLLPAAAVTWDQERWLAALRHEFAHVVRQDYFVRWIAHVVCALYWVNPLAWLALRRLRAAQEAACDDLVLLAGTPPEDYAALLVDTARTLVPSGAGWRAAVAMARPSTLEGRVLAIVDDQRNRRPASFRSIAAVFTCMAAMLAASALAQVAAAPRPAGDAAPAAKSNVEVLLNVKFVEVAKGALARLGVVPEGTPIQTIPAEKVSEVVKQLSIERGLDLVTAPSVTTRSGQRAEISVGREMDLPKGSEPPTKFVGTVFEVFPRVGEGTIELEAKVNWTSLNSARTESDGRPSFDERKVATTVSIRDGTAIFLRVGDLPPDRERFVIVQASVVTPTPELKGPAGTSRSPESADSTSSAKVAPPPPAEDAEEALMAIPVPGKPGFVTSPHAPNVGYVDIRGFPSGTKVKCPYTGRVFIVP
jgi:hypothetical protein